MNNINLSQFNEEPRTLEEGSVIHDYVEYSGIPLKDVCHRIRNFRKVNTKDFHEKSGIEDFYENSKTYVYDLLGAHWNLVGPANKLNKFLPGFMARIKDHPGQKLLEFGGGIGDICQVFETWANKEVTYMDIQSHITDFAIWRKNKYNLSFDVKIIPQEDFELTDTYDIIYHDAVIEHIPEDRQIPYIKKMVDALNPGGLYIQIIDLAGEDPDMPMHFKVDIISIFRELEKMGLTKIQTNGHFASVWSK